ncbi:hypothetical protein MIR68_008076 [Amoeboaphelidium protococcarum]|nr:hypothetical protein MIR68_008076 [Amoeboaphelidium protococcarum]
MSTQQQSQRQIYHEESLLRNQKAVRLIRDASSPLFGMCAGILGLTSYMGFVFYFAMSALLSGMILVFVGKGAHHSKYFPSLTWLLTEGVFGNVLSFVLFWTLFYGLVHVYD